MSGATGCEAACTAPQMRSKKSQHFEKIVKRAEGVARHAVQRLSVADICDLLSIPPRKISRAFQAVHGCPPLRYFRRQRYSGVRKELMKGQESATVSQIARRFAFTELGRFAVQYRVLFGESPSATLAKALARRSRNARRGGAFHTTIKYRKIK